MDKPKLKQYLDVVQLRRWLETLDDKERLNQYNAWRQSEDMCVAQETLVTLWWQDEPEEDCLDHRPFITWLNNTFFDGEEGRVLVWW